MKLLPFFLYQIPEAYLLIICALSLLGIKIRPKRLIIAGFGLGVLTEISRYFLFNLGLHTPVILFGLIVILVIAFELSISTAITGCFLSFFLLRLGESVLVAPFLSWTKLSLQTILANPWLHIAFGWLSASFLVITAIICNFGKVVLIKAPEANVKGQNNDI
ncbi:MAG: hypothetical protein ACUVRM_09680 [Bacillota bacterium]